VSLTRGELKPEVAPYQICDLQTTIQQRPKKRVLVQAVGVAGAELVAALLVSSIVGAITADVPTKKELNR
jgi:hypothetical protein